MFKRPWTFIIRLVKELSLMSVVFFSANYFVLFGTKLIFDKAKSRKCSDLNKSMFTES